MQPFVLEIAIAGGPCAGKTSGRPLIAERLRAHGYRVLLLPEMATLLYGGGVPDIEQIADERRPLYVSIQETLAFALNDLRGRYRALAAEFSEPVIILSDRGELDLPAYLADGETELILARQGVRWESLVDSYDAVVYLRTAARVAGGEIGNNTARRESSVEEAERACQRTLAGWCTHPQLYVIEVQPTLDAKVAQAVAAILAEAARIQGQAG